MGSIRVKGWGLGVNCKRLSDKRASKKKKKNLYANGACPSGTERKTGDGQMRRRRERGSLWRLFRENTKTFLNDTF